MQDMMTEYPRKHPSRMTWRPFRDHKPISFARLLTALLTLVAAICVLIIPKSANATSSSKINVNVSGDPVTNITTSPVSLTPAFSQSTYDYALRCQAGTNTITLTLTAQQGTIKIAGQSGSTLTVTVSVAENQAIVVRAPNLQSPQGLLTQYWIRCLPHDFPQMQVTGTGLPGWYLTGNITSSSDNTSGTYAMILDQNGTPVWYRAAPGGVINFELLHDETLAWAPILGPIGLGANPNGAYTLYDLDSGTTSSLAAPISPTDPHELLQLPDGNLMMFSSPLKSNVDLSVLGSNFAAANNTIVDCVVQEVDPTGNLIWQWDANNHVAIAESTLPALVNINGQTVADPYHCNSIDFDPVTQDVLVSMRNASAVYLLPPQGNGPIIWKLAGQNGSANPDHPQLISITGDPEGTISGQHDARFESDGGISVYDDHVGLSGNSRGVEYMINTSTQTATFEVMFSSSGQAQITGSFRRYSSGTDNLVGWGLKPGSGFTEFDVNGTQLFDVKFPNGELTYRSVKVPLDALNIHQLRETAGQS